MSCSTISHTFTTTVATVTVTVTPGAAAAPTSLSHSGFTSGACDVSAPAPAPASSSTISAWTSTEELSATTPATWKLTTYTGFHPVNTTEPVTATHCASGHHIAGINTVNGTSGTSYLVCAVSTASYPTVGTITGKFTADAVGATRTSGFSFFPTGSANATSGPVGSGTGYAAPTSAVVAPTQSIVPFTGGAATVNSKKTIGALAAVALAMVFN